MSQISSLRRKTIQACGGLVLYPSLASAAILTSRKAFAQQPKTPACGKHTPPQMEGPFFTPLSPERTKLIDPGMKAPIMRLMGQVVDTACRPIPGALLDFWQCDDKGRYDNQSYVLRGHQYANTAGEFRLETLVPGAYPGRTPHLHVKVQPRNGPVLTTQLYLPGHPGNARDFLFDPRLVIAPKGSEFHFQFVLAT